MDLAPPKLWSVQLPGSTEDEDEFSTLEADPAVVLFIGTYKFFVLIQRFKGPSLPYLFFAYTLIIRFRQEIWRTCRMMSA